MILKTWFEMHKIILLISYVNLFFDNVTKNNGCTIINITALDQIVYFSKTIYLFLKQFIFIVEELISLLKCMHYWLWVCQSNMCDRQNMFRNFSDSCNVWKIFWSKLSIVQISWDYNKVINRFLYPLKTWVIWITYW